MTGDPLKGAKFHITYASNNTSTGEINDLGDCFTDANGQIKLDKVQDGWYKVTELEAPAGYSIKQPATQEAYIKAGGSKTFTFENVPLSAIIIKKIDADSGKVLPGAWFRIRYLGGTSGTGGTTIGEYMTSSNGTIVKTGLKSGTYVIEEISAPEGYVIDNSAQTVYLSGKEQDVITVTFGNAKKGSLLIVKKDAATGKPLSDVEFQLTGSDGNVIGNSNGKYVTDSSGTIRVDGLEPGMTVIAKETRTRPGYVLDDVPQTIKIKANETMTLEFRNQPKGSLIIVKKDSVTGKPLPGVEFKITTSSGELVPDNEGLTSTNGIYKTNANGQIVLLKLTPGTYVVSETKTVDGYELNTTSQTVVVSANDAQTLTFLNTPKGKLLIEKIDSVTRSPLPGATFEIKGSSFPATSFTTNSSGQILLQDLTSGDYTIEEKRAPDGYRFENNSRVAKVEAGKTAKITIENEPLGGLLLKKMNSVTKEPLSDVIFKVTRIDGTVVGTANGEYRTDERGFITIPDLEPGGYVVQEVKAKPGFLLDDTPKHIEIKNHQTYSLEFFNQPKGGLVVIKKDSITGAPLKDVEFKITTSTGEVVDSNEGVTSSNGIYKTDENGVIEISKLQPGTYIITETKTLPNYVLDAAPQTVVVNANDTQTITFTNTPKGCLLVKKIDSVTHAPLSGVKFEVRGCNGCDYPAGTYTTDSNGTFRLAHIPSGCYSITETQAKDGYRLDDTAQIVKVEAGACKEVPFENEPLGGLLIKKMSATTKEPISDVLFSVTHADGTSIGISNGQFRTNAEGFISIPDLEPGTYIVKEVQAKSGFLLDDTPKTVTIKDHQTYVLEVLNQPKSGLLIVKKDSQTGEPLEGVEFKVTTSTGEVVDSNERLTTSNGIYRTDSEGEIFISKLKPDTYVVSEVKTLPDYVLDAPPQTVAVEANDMQVLTFTNTKKGCLLIEKVDSVTKKPLSGVKFEIKGCNGNSYPGGEFTTDGNGVIQLDHLPSGDYTVVEKQAKDGYRLDSTVQTVNVEAGKTRKQTFENEPLGGLLLKKMDSKTKEPLSDVIFRIIHADGTTVGTTNSEFRTDEQGYISLPNLEPGSYIITEMQAKPGYLLDDSPQTITIKDHQTYVLEVFNTPLGGLLIRKMDASTKEPLSDVVFKITTSDGTVIGTSNGEYHTDEKGYISLPDLEPGSYIVTEVRTKTGYLLDSTPKTIEIKDHQLYTLDFYNQPFGGLIVQKLDSVTKKPLQGVQFKITTADGAFVPAEDGKLSSNGLYFTDENGQIVLPGLAPNTYIVTEVATIDGYTIDEASRSQTVVVNTDDIQTLYFYNAPAGGLELIKVNEANQSERIPNVTFEIRRMDGGLVKTVTTDTNGRVHAPLDAGDYYAVEIKAGTGFKIDSTPHYFTVKDGETTTLTITNKRFAGILLHKIDSVTGKGIYGVTFLLYDGSHNPIDQFTTDQDGYAYIDTLDLSGKVYLKELENQGYIVDTQTKTVYVKPGETTEIEWKNTPITGQIQITKTSEDYNTMNGWAAGTPLPNTVFEIYDRANNLVDTIKTDKNGIASSQPLPLGRYTVKETQAAEFYGLNSTPIEAEIEFAGQIVRLAMTNKAVYTNVSITKRGYTQVVPGQQIKYDITNSANNSTDSLTSFYWRDTLPTAAVRLDKIVTGTYNVQGNYKIIYKTNYSQDYRTLADNLSTMQSYVLDASPAALNLGADECVTEFMVVFGVVPANFRMVEGAQVLCNVGSWLTGSSQFVNQADVGGIHNGQWIMATDRWVTTVYKPSEPLPKTGY